MPIAYPDHRDPSIQGSSMPCGSKRGTGLPGPWAFPSRRRGYASLRQRALYSRNPDSEARAMSRPGRALLALADAATTMSAVWQANRAATSGGHSDQGPDQHFGQRIPDHLNEGIGNEIVIEGSVVDHFKMVLAIRRPSNLPTPQNEKKGMLNRLFKS